MEDGESKSVRSVCPSLPLAETDVPSQIMLAVSMKPLKLKSERHFLDTVVAQHLVTSLITT